MLRIAFLGNSASMHLHTWEKIYGFFPLPVLRLFTVHPSRDWGARGVRIFFGIKIVSYIMLGLYLRFICKEKYNFIHAHGGSGYGLSAALSGIPFVVTIYGSEVLGSHSLIYRFMMRFILSRAQLITVTAEHVANELSRNKKISNRVSVFHTGLDFDALDSIEKEGCVSEEMQQKQIILSVRNCSSHYRVHNVIEAFYENFPISQSNVELRVILGNGDVSYFNDLARKYNRSDIVFIPQMLGYKDLIAEISKASVCISFPKTDQLSSTLLEVVYMGTPLISSDLISYAELKALVDRGVYVDFVADSLGLVNAIPSALERMPLESFAGQDIRQYLRDRFSIESAAKKFFAELGWR